MDSRTTQADKPYFALVLDERSRTLLRNLYATLPVPKADHCTVAYGTSDAADLPPAFRADDLGKSFSLVVVGTALRPERGIETVVVALRPGPGQALHAGFSANSVPHITVATDDRTPARESNAVLGEGYDPVTDGPELVATLLAVLPAGAGEA